MVEPIFDYQFRLILIGDSTVGKSTLLKAFTDGKFHDVCDPTVGVDFFARLIEVKKDVRVKLQLWDTAGQERFRSITRSYYRNSVGALLLYDITRRSTFEHLVDWLFEVKRHIEPQKVIYQWPAANTMNPGQQLPSIPHCCCLHGRAGGIVPPVQPMHCCAAEGHHFRKCDQPSGVELVRGRTPQQYRWPPVNIRSTDKNDKVS
ncbi:RAS oncogene family member Rab39 isoform X2 [Rhipicephalus microplus]|uniref:RAS oncogene family member Rab39 isoform X2 n=1 Tax=Rhipicephalus microplus TaxID=6941 RepID=UPI003F6BC86C